MKSFVAISMLGLCMLSTHFKCVEANGSPVPKDPRDAMTDVAKGIVIEEKVKQAQRAGTVLNPVQAVPFLDGDIMLTEEIARLMRDHIKENRKKRKILNFDNIPTKKWPSTNIKYNYDGVLDENAVEKIERALKVYMNYTCLTFERISNEGNLDIPHLQFTSGSGCLSFAGMSSDSFPQPIYFAAYCTTQIGIILHEIGHALGLWHEQQRGDREQYVTINEANIQSDEKGFVMFDDFFLDTKELMYDYASVMHYGGWDFSKNSQQTIETKNELYQKTIGQRVELSFLDKKIVNLEYCADACGSVTIECLNDGFQDPKNCNQCICPDGFGGADCGTLAPSRGASCGQQILETGCGEQELVSPGYGAGGYSNGQFCTWKIVAPEGSTIKLRFEGTFGVHDYNDRTCFHWVELRFKDNLHETGPRFCGTTTPSVNLESTSNEVLVILKTEWFETNSDHRRGFKLIYSTDGHNSASSNPCDSNPCQNSGTCTPAPNGCGFTCECQEGFSGDTCENAACGGCNISPGELQQPCYVTEAPEGLTGCTTKVSYSVKIQQRRSWFRRSYYYARRYKTVSVPCPIKSVTLCCDNAISVQTTEGPACAVPSDRCDNNPCQNLGTCNPYGKVCTCPPGYVGENCDEYVDPCSSNPCVRGECSSSGNSYQCSCPSGYTGINCESVIDPCLSTPCVRGQCISNGNSYRCLCPSGYTGLYCDSVIDPCENNQCINGRCEAKGTGYVCTCNQGFQGTYCDEQVPSKIDTACESNPCYHMGTCIPEEQGYRCECQTAFSGPRCEYANCGGCRSPAGCIVPACDTDVVQEGVGTCYRMVSERKSYRRRSYIVYKTEAYSCQSRKKQICCKNAVEIMTNTGMECAVPGLGEWGPCSSNCGGCGKQSRQTYAVSSSRDGIIVTHHQTRDCGSLRQCSHPWWMFWASHCCSGYCETSGNMCRKK